MTTSGPAAQASTPIPVQEVQVSGHPAHAVVQHLGNVTAASVTVGTSATQQRLFMVRGLNLTTNTPTVVLVQPRQAENQNNGWPDEYAVQVITTSKTEIQVLVRRLDLNAGWGQNLRLDFLIVD
jgi:hypothetical protein